MLHAPRSATKEGTEQGRTALPSMPECELHPLLARSVGLHSAAAAGNRSPVHAIQVQRRQKIAGLQSILGNRAVQRMLYHSTEAQIATSLPLAGGLLQRRCACGGTAGPHDECAACRAMRLGLQRLPADHTDLRSTVPHIVNEVLRSPGQPLDGAVRAFLEPRLGHDLSEVRVHTYDRAAESAKAINALAYTVGRAVVFGPGQYAPGTAAGRRLLAHELVHTIQQRKQDVTALAHLVVNDPDDAYEWQAECVAEAVVRQETGRERPFSAPGTPTLQRTNGGSLETPGESEEPTVRTNAPHQSNRLGELLSAIASETAESLRLRNNLDELSPESSEARNRAEATLAESRLTLIVLLEERIALLEPEIMALRDRIGLIPISKVETEPLRQELARREEELRQHEQQLRPLKRWQTRREIGTLEAEIGEINNELATLPTVPIEADPMAKLLKLRRADLERRKQELVASLTSTAIEYKQFDVRWGAVRYGSSPECTNVKEAGCGPTSLAIVLNYLYQEDPESLAAAGELEVVTPEATVPYAATHGRICNKGTAGDTMVTQVHTPWPGCRGRKLNLEEATGRLRSGSLVIFLCHGCTGQRRDGTPKTYAGHFMVLSGVNEAETIYNVLDPGAREARDIETISRVELEHHTGGFWIIEMK